jgi:hypothetical protein
MVESLAKALDLSNDDIFDMFRRARRDPSILPRTLASSWF